MSHPYFPMFIDLSEKRALVVGAGRIASRRIGTLVQFCPCITVVAPELRPETEQLEKDGKITILRRPFEPEDVEGMDIVLAATNDKELNRRVYELCKQRAITVNVCSDGSLCDFYFPGVVRRGDVVVGVTASNTDHALAKTVRQRIDAFLEE